MDNTIKIIAGLNNIDPRILQQIYQNGYSDGYDDATFGKYVEKDEKINDDFYVERARGQKE